MPSNPVEITITRTDNAPGIPNEWKIDGPTSSAYARSVEEALLQVRVIMERVEADQVHR